MEQGSRVDNSAIEVADGDGCGRQHTSDGHVRVVVEQSLLLSEQELCILLLSTLFDSLFKNIRPIIQLEGLDVLESLANFSRSSIVSFVVFLFGLLTPGGGGNVKARRCCHKEERS